MPLNINLQAIKQRVWDVFMHPMVKTPAMILGLIVVLIFLFFAFLHIFTRHGQGFPVPDFTELSYSEAKNLAQQSKLRLEVSDSVYIITREPGTVLEQNPLPGTYVKQKRRVFVVINAQNPKLVEMPDIVGYTLRQAKSRLETQGFNIGRLYFTTDIAVNIVLEVKYNSQEVEKGDEIPMGTKVDLVLGRGLANERTVLPRLIGLTYEEARNLLIDASLNIGKASYDQSVRDHRDSLMARVYSQYPEPSGVTPISFGSNVDVMLTVNEQRIPRLEPQPEVDSVYQQYTSEPEEEVME